MSAPPTLKTNAAGQSILDHYQSRTEKSRALAEEAKTLFPSGVTHDSRYVKPYGIYVTHAAGALKWDVDGNEYVDFFGGHGALLLGHSHPEIVTALKEASASGTHFGANHKTEIEWGKLVCQLVPAAQRVRFTSSGTEATQMAIRLSRAATGRHKVLRFPGHFHGWGDEVTTGFKSHFDGTPPNGVLDGVANSAVLVEAGDLDAVQHELATNKDIAAVILEPLGSATGMVPVSTEFLVGLRELTTQYGVILIFDEVVTGFRVSRGGVQGAIGVTPDLTTLAKILAGGSPGGAVVGRADLLAPLDFEQSAEQGLEKIYHPGTYNANPVSAATGRAALSIIANTDACERASNQAAKLREKLTRVLLEAGVPWGVYGVASVVHLFMNPMGRDIDPSNFDPFECRPDELRQKPSPAAEQLRLAMLVNGVDCGGWPIGVMSIAHDDTIVDRTADAFSESLTMLKREGLI